MVSGLHRDICTERRWVSEGETTDNGWQLAAFLWARAQILYLELQSLLQV